MKKQKSRVCAAKGNGGEYERAAIKDFELNPKNYGENCLGNGRFFDAHGNKIEMRCYTCYYLKCCVSDAFPEFCRTCEYGVCINKIENLIETKK